MLDTNSQSGTSGSGIGNVVQGLADINQAIGIILSTPKGSDPLRPTFACDLFNWIDVPLTIARPNLVREIVEALTKWEPRIRVLRVTVDVLAISQLSIGITWELAIGTRSNPQATGVGQPIPFGAQTISLTITYPNSSGQPVSQSGDIASTTDVSRIQNWSRITR